MTLPELFPVSITFSAEERDKFAAKRTTIAPKWLREINDIDLQTETSSTAINRIGGPNPQDLIKDLQESADFFDLTT